MHLPSALGDPHLGTSVLALASQNLRWALREPGTASAAPRRLRAQAVTQQRRPCMSSLVLLVSSDRLWGLGRVEAGILPRPPSLPPCPGTPS